MAVEARIPMSTAPMARKRRPACPECHGLGFVAVDYDRPTGAFREAPCPTCGGSGRS